MPNYTCDTKSVPPVSWLQALPRVSHLSPFRFESVDAPDIFDSQYWTQLGLTTAIIPGAVALLPALLLLCCGLCCCCCRCWRRRAARPTGKMRLRYHFLYALSLLSIAGAVIFTFTATRGFNSGVRSIIDTYEDTHAKLDTIDGSAVYLDGQINEALPHLQNLIDSKACPVFGAQLVVLNTSLVKVQGLLEMVQTSYVGPVVDALDEIDVDGKIDDWGILPAFDTALLLPTGAALLAVILEVIRLLVYHCCPNDTGCCAPPVLACISRFLLFLASLVLVITTGGYFFTTLLAADWCADADGDVVAALDVADVDKDAKNLLEYWTVCTMSDTADEMRKDLKTGEVAFRVVTVIMYAWDQMCPPSPDSEALSRILDDTWPIYQKDVMPLYSCDDWTRENYCHLMGDGFCQGVGDGAAQSLIGQLLLLWASLIATVMASCVAVEVRRQTTQKQSLLQHVHFAPAEAGEPALGVSVQQPPPPPHAGWMSRPAAEWAGLVANAQQAHTGAAHPATDPSLLDTAPAGALVSVGAPSSHRAAAGCTTSTGTCVGSLPLPAGAAASSGATLDGVRRPVTSPASAVIT